MANNLPHVGLYHVSEDSQVVNRLSEIQESRGKDKRNYASSHHFSPTVSAQNYDSK